MGARTAKEEMASKEGNLSAVAFSEVVLEGFQEAVTERGLGGVVRGGQEDLAVVHETALPHSQALRETGEVDVSEEGEEAGEEGATEGEEESGGGPKELEGAARSAETDAEKTGVAAESGGLMERADGWSAGEGVDGGGEAEDSDESGASEGDGDVDEEEGEIAASDAVIEPTTVVIEGGHAFVALAAVLGGGGQAGGLADETGNFCAAESVDALAAIGAAEEGSWKAEAGGLCGCRRRRSC